MNIPILLEVLKRRSVLRAREQWTRPELEKFQSHCLQLLRQYAYARSPFYQRFHKNYFDAPLNELPVVNKSLIMEHFDDVVTDRSICLRDAERHLGEVDGDQRVRNNYWVCASSGSSGPRGIFLFNFEEWVTILASFDRGSRWSGLKPRMLGRSRVAAVTSTTPWHMSSRATATVSNWFVPVLRLDAGAPIATIVESLNEWLPDLVIAYPSIMRRLLEEQRAKRLQIFPSVVLTGSEVLSSKTRDLIQRTWEKNPFDQYAATEAGLIAAECDQHSGLHVFDDHVILEVVDRNYRPVPPGVPGERALITVLFGRTQPLIRYELTDILRISNTSCQCGRPFAVMAGVEGRTDNLLQFRAGDGGQVLVHPIVFERLMEAIPVLNWQVIKQGDALRILLSGAAAGYSDERLIQSVKEELLTQGVLIRKITIERVHTIPRGLTGKVQSILENF